VKPSPLARDGRLRHRVLALGPFIVTALLLALLWTVVLVSSVVQQRRIADDAQAQLQLINNAVVQHTRGLLQGVEGNLKALDHWVQSHPETNPRQDAALAELVSRLDQGGSGLVSLSFASNAGLNVSVPSTLSWHARMPPVTWPSEPGRIQVGVPVRSAADQRWRWPITLRLSEPSAEIAGVVAWVDLASLGALHETMRAKPAGGITLTRSDAVVILRTPFVEGVIGRDLNKGRNNPLPVQPASAPYGVFAYDGALAADAIERMVSYERLGNYPVTVLVSQGVNTTMATFHARRRVLIAGLIGVTLFALAFSVLLARSQRAARRSQAELAALSDAFPLGIFRTDMSGETIYANDAYFDKLGLTRERLAWGWSEIVHDSPSKDVKADWKLAVSEGRPLTNMLQVRLPGTGREAVMSIHTAPLRVDGRLVGQVGAVEDVTDRIQQQKAQRMLTAIFEQSTDVVAQLAPDGRVVYLNPAGRARMMLGPDDPLGSLHFEQMTPKSRLAQVREEIVPAALENGVWVGETSVLGGDGREISMSEMLIVHRDDKRRVEAFSVVMRDITFDLQARMELQRSESILNVVAANLPARVAVVDKAQRYLFTNDAFDRWIGQPSAHTVGRHAREVIGEAEYARRQLHIEAALAGHHSMFESEFSGRTGSQFFETTYVPFNNAEGEVAGFVALSQDITAHRLERQKLLDASLTDVLTGVLNRAGFDLRIHEAVDRAQREERQLALLCIDLDGFKPVNDAHGHAAGDALLSAVAKRLQRILRPNDVLARLGGDEFGIVLPDVKDVLAAQAVARKIVSTLGEPFQIDTKAVCIGSSVGVALVAHGNETVQALMHRADAALYQAKRAGRGRFEVAETASQGLAG
jgi:diguanylate cyclase (GGDEF)-like protein/PAS domain S-box-containing protein